MIDSLYVNILGIATAQQRVQSELDNGQQVYFMIQHICVSVTTSSSFGQGRSWTLGASSNQHLANFMTAPSFVL